MIAMLWRTQIHDELSRNSFLPITPTDSVEIKNKIDFKIDQDDIMWDKLLELDLFNDKIIGLKNATCSNAGKILNDKWTLQSNDKRHDCNVSQIWIRTKW
jgi:hypothetical protein